MKQDFFKVKQILKDNINETSETLEDIISEIFMLEMLLSDGDK